MVEYSKTNSSNHSTYTVTFSGTPSIVMFNVEFLNRLDRLAKMLSGTITWVFLITTDVAFKIGGSNGGLARKKWSILSLTVVSIYKSFKMESLY